MLSVIDQKYLLKVAAIAWLSPIMVPFIFEQRMLSSLQFIAVTVLTVLHMVFSIT
jgi:hypothetical protein